jgi:hypothetical protein
MVNERQSETAKRTRSKWYLVVLGMVLLGTLFSFGVLGTGTAGKASAHAAIPNCSSNVPMYTRDDGWWADNKYVGIYVPTDVSNLYNLRKAYITYDQGNDHFRFTYDSTDPFRMQTRGDQGVNLWGVSTRWTWTHSNWRTTNSWWAHYNC